MEGIGAAVAIINLVDIGFQLVQDVSYRFAADSYASRRFGRVSAFLMSMAFMHPTTLGEFEWDLNTWSDKEIIDWKNSHLAGCQSTAIASTIIGSIALSALQLPDMGQAHWTARAILISGMALAVLSVVAACFQQMVIGMLNQAVEIRLWLCDRFRQMPGHIFDEEYLSENRQLPLRSSLAAQQMTRIPFALLIWAIYCFLVGFGLYLGFAWKYRTKDTDFGQSDNRNVFIVFLLTTSLSIVVFAAWALLKEMENFRGHPERLVRVPQNTIRKVKRALVSKVVQETIQPLIAFRDHLTKSSDKEDKRVFEEPGLHGPSEEFLANATALMRVLERAAIANRECAEANKAVAAEFGRLLNSGLGRYGSTGIVSGSGEISG